MKLEMPGSAGIPTASPGELQLNRYFWVFLVVTNAVDVLASRRAFQFGIAEVNPVADLIISMYGVAGLGLFKAFWLLALLAFLPFVRGFTQALLGFACLAYFLLTIAHIWFLSPLL